MSEIFLIHAEEDADIAISLATHLENSGYSTWYYERDTLPGSSYLLQISRAIDNAKAVILLISDASLDSHQVTTEVIRVYEANKPIFPVLIDVTHVEFQKRQPEWCVAVGASASISLARHDVATVSAALLKGLALLQIGSGKTRPPELSQPLATPATHKHATAEPFPGFRADFRELISAQRTAHTGALLHIAFGNIADIRDIPVVIPVSQTFDFDQRHPRSVLGSFENVQIDGRPFFEALEKQWPARERSLASGLGESKYLALPKNSHNLPGVMFVVTTRDLGTANHQYGLYVNTPIEGIELILNKIIESADANRLGALSIPLMGTGFANISRTMNHARLKSLLKQVVTLLTIEKLLKALSLETSALRRAIIVIHAQQPHCDDEHALWQAVVHFLGSRAGSSGQIDTLISEINALCP